MSTKIKSTSIWNMLLALAAVAIIVYFYPHAEAYHYKYEEGRPWNYAKLIAPFDIPINADSATIIRVRDSLSNNIVPVYTRVKGVSDSVITSMMSKWTDAGETFVSEADAANRRRAISFIKRAYGRDIIDKEGANMIDERHLANIKMLEGNTTHNYPTRGIISIDDLYDNLLNDLQDSAGTLWAAKYNIYESLMPNLVYDEEATRTVYDYEFNRLTAFKGVIVQGQTIIDKGTVISPQDYTNLQTYERMLLDQISNENSDNILVWGGQFLYVALLFCCLMAYLFYSAPEIWNRRQSMLFIFVMITIFFILAVAASEFINYGMYFVPFAIVSVLMIVFFDAPTALMTSFSLIILCAGITTLPLEFIFIELAAVVASVYSLKKLSQRSQLLRTSLFVALSYWIAYLAIELMLNGSLEGFSWRLVAYLAIAALLSSVAYIFMVAIERTFGFVSAVTLIELSDVNNPLLRKLSEECPGTFQHSMAVSNLATDAAIKIGANEQLVRAGALYHDIGKMGNPNFFTENQRGVNPHDALPPERSAQIVVQHVTDGLAAADKYGLPSVIKDFIREHHGAGKAKYFYYTYCKAHPDEVVDEKPFMYPGPNPRSRETSLLMMADAVEAASRSLTTYTPEAITELVNKIIDGQIADGMHNDSTLSFKDVNTIKQVFIRRLTTMYHSRVAYPDAK